MTLIFINHKFRYELERVFRTFFPPVKINLSNTKDDAKGDFCLTERELTDNDKILLSVELRAGKAHYFMSEEVPLSAEPNEQERVLSVLLYKALREYTGMTPPWGILTGVRPAKVLRSYSDEDADRRLYVSKEKIQLARLVEEIQEPLAVLPEKSFSLYASIPFCPTRCSYCSFVSHSVDKAADRIDEYVGRLCEELAVTADIAKKAGLRLDTIYIGGGTPTTLSVEQLKRLFGALDAFDRSYVREFTVEAGRPDTITRAKLEAIRAAGAERVSVNPQTMHDSVLNAIGRCHTTQQTEESFRLARDVGFSVINMDLIAGLPSDDFTGFKMSLDRVCELAPENITVHSLSLKRASTLFHNVAPLSADAVKMVTYAHNKLNDCGYVPYYLYRQKNTAGNQENTGYAKPGTENLYNMFIMEEIQTILACGAGGISKIIGSNGITRVANYKYPYEYLDRFDQIIDEKKKILGCFT